MKFDFKKFRNNSLFFIICLVSLAIILCLTLIGGDVNSLDEEDLKDGESTVNKLIINEVMSSNGGTIIDEDGKLYDYIELYNGNDHDINLKNYGLSDTNNEIKYTFPETTIKSKGYLIVYLSGTSGVLHAPFKLKSSGGETLGLFKPSGKIIDAVETVPLSKDTVMARNNEGKWVIQKVATPGFANTIDGHKDFIESLSKIDESTIKINEFLPNNKGSFKTKLYDEFSGYVEIINTGDKSVNIGNYSISNSTETLYKWQFPSISLSPNEVIVVYTSNKNITEGSELHTSFKLKNLNGEVVLSNKEGNIIDKVEYNNLGNGLSYVKSKDDFIESNTISPGYPNTLDGIKSFEKEYMKVPSELIINEAMNLNYSVLPQNGGNYYDWIELYNNTSKTIELSDYCLTTNIDTVCLFKLPKKELKSHEYYVVMASGEENLSNNTYIHTNFNLSTTQALYLTKSNKVIDSMFIANVPKGYSMGKSGSSGLFYFSNPTPLKANSSGVQAISYKVSSSIESGIYNLADGINVELYGGGTIYYTTDGSEPNNSSKIYSSPLNIKKTTVLKTMRAESGKINSEVSTYSYVVNENHSIPVISIVIPPSDLKNLHSHAWTEGYIKPCYAEYLVEGEDGFSIPAGLKLFGGSTRGHAKKSYELKFKKEFGASKLHYKVFDEIDSSVFDSLVLRSGSQDEMGSASKKTIIRDIVGTSLVSEYTTVDVQAYEPVAMYLNGAYWGLYFLREKIDETLVSNHYNVASSKTETDLLRIDGQVKSGNRIKFNSMISFINDNSLSNQANYDKIKEQIDIENICDFWIAEIWTANNDIVNVRYFSNPNVDNGKWKFIFYDLDFAFYNVNRNYLQFATSSGGMTSNHYSTILLRNLMKSNEFKKTFLERLSYNLKNTWNPQNVNKKIDDVIKEIGEDEIKRNLSRWNMSYSQWQNNISFLKSYATKRGSYVISSAKSYFGLSSSEAEKYFGGL